MLNIPQSTFEEKQVKNLSKFNVFIGEHYLKGWEKKKEKRKNRNWKYNRRIRKRSFKMDNWTIGDMVHLLRVYRVYGNHWQDICSLFRCQKDWQMKNRVFSLIRKALRTMLRLSDMKVDITCTKEILKLNTDALIAGTNTVFHFEGQNKPYVMLDVIERYAFLDYYEDNYQATSGESDALKEILEYFKYLNRHIIEEEDRFWFGKMKVAKKVRFKYRKSLMNLNEFLVRRKEDFISSCEHIQSLKNGEALAQERIDTKIKIVAKGLDMHVKDEQKQEPEERPTQAEVRVDKPRNKLEEMGIFPIQKSRNLATFNRSTLEKPIQSPKITPNRLLPPIPRDTSINRCFGFLFAKPQTK